MFFLKPGEEHGDPFLVFQVFPAELLLHLLFFDGFDVEDINHYEKRGEDKDEGQRAEDEKDYDAEEDDQSYRHYTHSTLNASGGYPVDIISISIPDTHFCYPFSVVSMRSIDLFKACVQSVSVLTA